MDGPFESQEAMELAQRLASLPPQTLQSLRRALDSHLARVTATTPADARSKYQSFDGEEPRAIVARFFSPL